jgi:hypothetical protein
MIQRRWFFDSVRKTLFGGHLQQSQVDGMNALLARADEGMDYRQFAYVLATTYWETAQTMCPIAEIGKGKGKPYGVPDPQTGQTYYGRGYVQITWKTNYEKLQAACGFRWGDRNQVTHADSALDPDIAADNIFYGMVHGLFTGTKLGDYITPDGTDWYNARRIVNALDHAQQIAADASHFHDALSYTPGTDTETGEI